MQTTALKKSQILKELQHEVKQSFEAKRSQKRQERPEKLIYLRF